MYHSYIIGTTNNEPVIKVKWISSKHDSIGEKENLKSISSGPIIRPLYSFLWKFDCKWTVTWSKELCWRQRLQHDWNSTHQSPEFEVYGCNPWNLTSSDQLSSNLNLAVHLKDQNPFQLVSRWISFQSISNYLNLNDNIH